MRTLLLLALALGLAAGCARKQPQPLTGPVVVQPGGKTAKPAVPPKKRTSPIVTPGRSLAGRVTSVNAAGRFIVVSFPIGVLPAPETRLGVYRNGLKVADVKFTTWQRDNLAVADILAGECQPGDEVKDQ
jgi:hypothetical protein